MYKIDLGPATVCSITCHAFTFIKNDESSGSFLLSFLPKITFPYVYVDDLRPNNDPSVIQRTPRDDGYCYMHTFVI